LGFSFLNLNFSIYPPQEKVNVEQAGDNSVEKVQLEAEETLEVLTISFFLNSSLISQNSCFFQVLKDVSGKVLNRGEKLSDLLARADDLDDTVSVFC